MSIEKNWKEINDYQDNDLANMLNPGRLQKLHSSNPLQKIKNLLFYSILWSVIISGGYIYIIIAYPFWPIILCIGIVLLFNCWVGYNAWQQYREILPPNHGKTSLLASLEKNYYGIKEWMRLQMKVAIFVYPIAAAGGFMLGGMMGSGKSIDYFMSKPVVLISLIITVLILVPICIYIAKWIFKKSFGKHLAHLKSNIDQLRNEQ